MNIKKIVIVFLFVANLLPISRAHEQVTSAEKMLDSREKAQWVYVQQSLSDALGGSEKDLTVTKKVAAVLKPYGWIGNSYGIVLAQFAVSSLVAVSVKDIPDLLKYLGVTNSKGKKIFNMNEEVALALGIIVGIPAGVVLANRLARLGSFLAEKFQGSGVKRHAALKSLMIQWHSSLDKVPSVMQPMVQKLYEHVVKNDLSLEHCDRAVAGILAISAAATTL